MLVVGVIKYFQFVPLMFISTTVYKINIKVNSWTTVKTAPANEIQVSQTNNESPIDLLNDLPTFSHLCIGQSYWSTFYTLQVIRMGEYRTEG